jgi:hypothetical protein
MKVVPAGPALEPVRVDSARECAACPRGLQFQPGGRTARLVAPPGEIAAPL